MIMKECNIEQVQVAVPQISRDEFLKYVAETLGTYQWPKGSIECINPNKTKLVYLWGNRIKGDAEGSWAAKVQGDHKITVNKKEIELKDGTPYSGPIPSLNFDLVVINDNQDTPLWAKGFTTVGFTCENFQPYSYIDACNGIIDGNNTDNSYAAWMKNGNEIVDKYLYSIAVDFSQNTALAYISLNVMPAEVIQQSADLFSNMKFNSKDVAVTSRHNVKEEPTPVLIPFYLLEFEFNGKAYYIAMMADNSYTLKGQIPPIEEPNKTPQQLVEEEMPDKVKKVKMIKWGWILAIILLFICNIAIAVVYLVFWVAAKWYFNKDINNRIKELEQQATENTKKTATLLMEQLTK